MRFKQFMRLDEIGDIDRDDVGDVRLEPYPYGSGKMYQFRVGREMYRVKFEPRNIVLGGITLTNNSVELTLSGPEGVDPTNLGTPHAIYTQMLRGIKKYLQDYQPEGLYFFGMNGGMDLVYASFFKRFLSDRPGKDPRFVFIRLDESKYLRKDVYDNLPPAVKTAADRSLGYWKSSEGEYMKDRRDNRQARMGYRRQANIPAQPLPSQPETPQERGEFNEI